MSRVTDPSRSSAAVHAGFGVLVAAPLLRPGSLLLLDFVYGPDVVVRWNQAPSVQGPVNHAPLQALLWLLRMTGPPAAFLFVFLLIFGMGYAMNRAIARVVPQTGNATRIVCGLLYAVNPFTYTRLVHGHVGLLAGMAVVPLLAIALVRLKEYPSAGRALVFGSTIAIVGFTSIHMAAMLVLLVPALLVIVGRPGARWLAISAGAALVLSSWWLTQWVSTPPPPFGADDLTAFATVPAGASAPGHVAALYGFWRVGEFVLPRDGVRAWPLTFAPIAVAIVWGFIYWWTMRRRAAVTLAALAILGIALASGTSFPPTAGTFRWLYTTVPGFTVFREPQKWVAVVLFSYALLAAPAVDRLARFADPPESGSHRFPTALVAAMLACIGLIAFYGRSMILNFDALRPVRFPADWHTANDTMRREESRALIFPWHLYITFPWTGNRIANPAETFFDVPVVASDSIEVGSIRTQSRNPESHAVERVVFDDGGHDLLDETLAGLCTRWVVLYKTADWETYAWLDSSPILTRAFDGPTIRLYRAAIPDCTKPSGRFGLGIP